jgi:RNA polymerase sigma-70 factor (ECF subfamily)
LFTIAGNVARNAARTMGRRREVSEIDAAPQQSGPQATLLAGLAMEASGMMPARLAEGAERAEIVRAAVQLLGERQREALLLSKFEGLSYQEIADVMGLTTKAVKSLLSRARVNLKEILEPYMAQGMAPGQDDGESSPTLEMGRSSPSEGTS